MDRHTELVAEGKGHRRRTYSGLLYDGARPSAPADGVFAMLHREDGEPFVDTKGVWLVTAMDTDRIYQLASAPSDNALITSKGAAAILAVSLATLKRMVRDERLPIRPVKVADSAVRFRTVDIY